MGFRVWGSGFGVQGTGGTPPFWGFSVRGSWFRGYPPRFRADVGGEVVKCLLRGFGVGVQD